MGPAQKHFRGICQWLIGLRAGADHLMLKQPMSPSLPVKAVLLVLVAGLAGCTDKIESTLPPLPAPPPPRVQNEIPAHLKALYLYRCASCHGEQGEKGQNIRAAASRSPKNWVGFLKGHLRTVSSNDGPAVELTQAEYAALGEWLARITKENRPARAPEQR